MKNNKVEKKKWTADNWFFVAALIVQIICIVIIAVYHFNNVVPKLLAVDPDSDLFLYSIMGLIFSGPLRTVFYILTATMWELILLVITLACFVVLSDGKKLFKKIIGYMVLVLCFVWSIWWAMNDPSGIITTVASAMAICFGVIGKFKANKKKLFSLIFYIVVIIMACCLVPLYFKFHRLIWGY